MENLNLALDYLCQNFGGQWLLLGGSLIRFDVDSTRGTHDIDLVRLDLESISEKTRLITEMKALGVSPVDISDVQLASKKWGLGEFNAAAFLGWASEKEIGQAKSIGLLP
jgi:hypothetical protein